MKFHETHFEEYIDAVKKINIHPELENFRENMPQNISQFGNLIVYGPSGVGKYSQVLSFIQKYSPSDLKYDKRMTMQHEKQNYTYRISDIHYDVDMCQLGCNSKIIWHEVFQQIVDIVSMKSCKSGIIVCHNFHTIHNELLEIFYSYMQQYNHPQVNIQIKFILLTEHVSFLPNNILNSCQTIRVTRPSRHIIEQMMLSKDIDTPLSTKIDHENILNLKELYMCGKLKPGADPPKEVFIIICDNIIQEMLTPGKIIISEFRDIVYDILIYNLDAVECIWYILNYFIQNEHLSTMSDISAILDKTHTFLKYYNNNYRPIYHLENILFFIIERIHRGGGGNGNL